MTVSRWVCDVDGVNFSGGGSAGLYGSAGGFKLTLQDVVRIVLHVAGAGIDLFKLLLGGVDDFDGFIKKEAA